MKKLELTLAACVLLAVTALAGIGTVTVGTSETQVLPAKADRTSLVLQNSGASDVFVKWEYSTNALTVTNGFKLTPGTGISFTKTDAANPARNKITAISSVTNATLTYQEDNAN